MKILSNHISILLILVLGTNCIISSFCGPLDRELPSFEQDVLSDAKIDGDLNFFIDASPEKIIVPSFKANYFGFDGLSLEQYQISGFLENGSLHLDWFKRKERFFDVIRLLYPFHFFL